MFEMHWTSKGVDESAREEINPKYKNIPTNSNRREQLSKKPTYQFMSFSISFVIPV